MSDHSKTSGQFARVMIKLAIGLAGLFLTRFIVESLPMIREAGWLVQGKVTVSAGAIMIVDALVLSVLFTFALDLRRYLSSRFPEVPGMAMMMADLVFLISTGLAYADFRVVVRAWPSSKPLYIWSFMALAAVALIQMLVLFYQNMDEITGIVLRTLMPRRVASQVSEH